MRGTAEDAIRRAHAWFETNSGWAPPDADTLAEWMADGVCRCPDECLVAPDAWCEHGLASWWLILRALEPLPAGQGGRGEPRAEPVAAPHGSRLDPRRPDHQAIIDAHRDAVLAGDPGYIDPTSGLFVMTSRFLEDRGFCCDNGCRHCPYIAPER